MELIQKGCLIHGKRSCIPDKFITDSMRETILNVNGAYSSLLQQKKRKLSNQVGDFLEGAINLYSEDPESFQDTVSSCKTRYALKKRNQSEQQLTRYQKITKPKQVSFVYSNGCISLLGILVIGLLASTGVLIPSGINLRNANQLAKKETSVLDNNCAFDFECNSDVSLPEYELVKEQRWRQCRVCYGTTCKTTQNGDSLTTYCQDQCNYQRCNPYWVDVKAKIRYVDLRSASLNELMAQLVKDKKCWLINTGILQLDTMDQNIQQCTKYVKARDVANKKKSPWKELTITFTVLDGVLLVALSGLYINRPLQITQ